MDIYPPDYASPVGQVRTLISDTTQEDYDQNGTPRYLLSDGQLTALISARGEGKLYGATADALRALAANEILIGKYIRTQDLQTDGAKVGDALRLLAREYENKQKQDDDDNALEEFAFEIVDFRYPYVNPEDTYRFGGF